jgi:hypothetical protein
MFCHEWYTIWFLLNTAFFIGNYNIAKRLHFLFDRAARLKFPRSSARGLPRRSLVRPSSAVACYGGWKGEPAATKPYAKAGLQLIKYP